MVTARKVSMPIGVNTWGGIRTGRYPRDRKVKKSKSPITSMMFLTRLPRY